MKDHYPRLNLPETGQKRIVIVGGGFAGLTLARKLVERDMQVVLLDRNNYHQFQPLLYQVAMAGLEPSSISFPFRKLFQNKHNLFLRICEVTEIQPSEKRVITSSGLVNYDELVIATGVDTNYFGNEDIEKHTLPMKSVSESLAIRNRILNDFEEALKIQDYDERQKLIDIVVVGGGPTGVELAGSLAEMKAFVIPKDYPEIDPAEIDIHLVEGGPNLLSGMSDKAGSKALEFLRELGVIVHMNSLMTDFDGKTVTLQDGTTITAGKVIWAAGVAGKRFAGLSDEVYGPANRLIVDSLNKVTGYEHIYAIGDIAYMSTESFQDGHPQVAQVAMQQAKNLASNMRRVSLGKEPKPFAYRDFGSLATVGRNKAVADLPSFKFQGGFAWFTWLVVHLFGILGVKNRIFVFLNWIWSYFTYDQSLRLIINRPPASPDIPAEPEQERATATETL